MSEDAVVGQNSDTTVGGLDSLGRALSRLAVIGMIPTRMVSQAKELKPCLELVEGDTARAATLIIEMVCAACELLELENQRFGEVASRLFGARTGERGLPYAMRLAAAADCWREGLAPGSFNRRHRPNVIRELQRTIMLTTVDTELAKFRAQLRSEPSYRPIERRDFEPNLAFRRLGFRAATYIEGSDPRPRYTDWHYSDIATTGNVAEFRISTREDDARLCLTPLTGNVEVEKPLGVDPYGYLVWRVHFHPTPERGQEFEWGVRKSFDRPQLSRLPREASLSLAASQPRPIESGSVTVDVTRAEVMPRRFFGFVTPKGTLPDLRGTSWELQPILGRATATFDYLTPWHSHGVQWVWGD